jgi:hypothetical protein
MKTPFILHFFVDVFFSGLINVQIFFQSSNSQTAKQPWDLSKETQVSITS